jgi:hypothetical protein
MNVSHPGALDKRQAHHLLRPLVLFGRAELPTRPCTALPCPTDSERVGGSGDHESLCSCSLAKTNSMMVLCDLGLLGVTPHTMQCRRLSKRFAQLQLDDVRDGNASLHPISRCLFYIRTSTLHSVTPLDKH